MLRNPGLFGWDTRRRPVGRPADGQCHRKLNRRRRKPSVRVKRCGKSAPREAQATRHGKPHRVQGQIGNRGAARSASAKADRFRVSVAQTNDSLRRKAQTEFGLQPGQNHFAPSAEGRRQNDEAKRLRGVFIIHQAYFFIGSHTAGSLKFPSRSTARMKMASGLPLLK